MKLRETKSWKQLLNMAAAENVTWWVFALLTDELILDEWQPGSFSSDDFQEKEPKLLELHIFSEKAEYRAIRSDIGREFRESFLSDEKNAEQDASGNQNAYDNYYGDYYDEEQYLDIDATTAEQLKKSLWQVRTTGGGTYTVPLSDYQDARIVIRNYVSYYEDSGQSYMSDWRMAGLKGGAE